MGHLTLIPLSYDGASQDYENSLPRKLQTFASSVPWLYPSGIFSTLQQAPNSSVLIEKI